MLESDGLASLVRALRGRDYRVIGPVVRDDAIVYDEIDSADDLPEGVGDEQEPGRYRLVARSDRARFGFTVGPQGWKRHLFPPDLKLFSVQRKEDQLSFELPETPAKRLAFLGVRACELRAIEVQDRVFLRPGGEDRAYGSLRERLFVVAVQCGRAASTCFCVSAGAGPRARSGFDLALTELLESGEPQYLAETGSPEGEALLGDLPHRAATSAEVERGARVSRGAEEQMRALPAGDLRASLYAAREHPRWDDVAERCLGCGNCTLVCPTCFCTRVEDTSDLRGDHAERWRHWDSCFSQELSHLHGGDVRVSTRARYRQWLTHKLASWHDQFGTSGCVGCGRCLTWCPVGIDLTEEAHALCEEPALASDAREDPPA